MKNLIIALSLLAFSLSHLQAENMQVYLRETQKLAKSGKYKEALERYVWFHDHSLEHERAMVGVRLSFALMYWKELGDVYPPALKKMEKTRDAKQNILLGGKGDNSLFQDVCALNRTLGEDKKSIKLFREIESKDSQRAEMLWLYIKDTVFELGEYDLAKNYVKDYSKSYKIAYAGYLRDEAMFEDADGKDWNRKNFVKKCIQIITVADMTGHGDIALEIKNKALNVVDDDKLRDLKLKVKASKQ
ncbi:MAG: hypothetical protein L3J39_13520 [Verrucomicrobiales bacterium]|nr:hypothetical protein [Verrucomicrobiales bacterium]